MNDNEKFNLYWFLNSILYSGTFILTAHFYSINEKLICLVLVLANLMSLKFMIELDRWKQLIVPARYK
jgi:hypothetical protein